MVDSLWSSLTDSHINLPMGVTAENLAKKYGVTREECDAFALQSQARWKAGEAASILWLNVLVTFEFSLLNLLAFDAGHFNDEIAPVTLKGRKGPEEVGLQFWKSVSLFLGSLLISVSDL